MLFSYAAAECVLKYIKLVYSDLNLLGSMYEFHRKGIHSSCAREYYYNLVPRPGWKNCSCMHAPAKVGNSDMHVDIFRVFDRRLEVSNDYAMRTSMLFP